MTKNDLVDALVERGYYKNQANEAVRDIFLILAEALVAGDSFAMRGFGSFEVKTRKGRLGQDVHTKERRVVDDYRVIVFKTGDNLKDALKNRDPEKLRILSGTGK